MKTLVNKYKVNQQEIAVLTQYRQQCTKLEDALKSDLPRVKVSTVVMSQGKTLSEHWGGIDKTRSCCHGCTIRPNSKAFTLGQECFRA